MLRTITFVLVGASSAASFSHFCFADGEIQAVANLNSILKARVAVVTDGNKPTDFQYAAVACLAALALKENPNASVKFGAGTAPFLPGH